MRLATFNVENLFARAKALRSTSIGEVNPVLRAFDRFNTVWAKVRYESADRVAMLEDLETLGILDRTSSGSVRMTRPPRPMPIPRRPCADVIDRIRSGNCGGLPPMYCEVKVFGSKPGNG